LKNACRESSSPPFHLLNGLRGEEPLKGIARERQESGEAQKRRPMRERREARVFSFFSFVDDDDDVDVDVGALQSPKKRYFPRTRSLFSGPHYPYRHGYDCVSSSPPASGLEPRRRTGESERERGEKKLLDECFFREKTKQGLFAHPRVFSPSRRLVLTRRTPRRRGRIKVVPPGW